MALTINTFMDRFKLFVETDRHLEHEVLNMYLSRNHKVAEISELTGLSTGNIYRILQRHEVSPQRRAAQPGQYETVYNFADSGLSARRIAELSGYSLRQVYNILASRAVQSPDDYPLSYWNNTSGLI